jgi:hypothetical protein
MGRDHNDPLFLQVKEAQGLRPGQLCGAQHLPITTESGCGRPASYAGGHRHLPGLAAH